MQWCGTWTKADLMGGRFGNGKCRRSDYHNGEYGFAQMHPSSRIERPWWQTTERLPWERSGPHGANTTGMVGLGRRRPLTGDLPSFELLVILSTVGYFWGPRVGSWEGRLYRVSSSMKHRCNNHREPRSLRREPSIWTLQVQ